MTSFGKQVAGFNRKARARIDAVERGAKLEAMRRIVKRTPTLTGRARAHWFIGDGEVTNATDTSGNVSIRRAEAALDAETGTVTTFVNPLPYANLLEFGWSDQAPNGMVRATAAEWDDIVAVAVRDARATS